LSGAPQGSTLGPLLFNISVNDLSAKIKHTKFLLFPDDLNVHHNVKSGEDCKALQADIYSVQHWYAENHMEINIQKTRIISFTRKTNSVHFNYYVSNVIILRSYVKDLGIMLCIFIIISILYTLKHLGRWDLFVLHIISPLYIV
jgi:hypothetical protein